MKYRPELGKVRRMLCERLEKLTLELNYDYGSIDEEWTKVCSSIGIIRTAVRTENEIAMDDPCANMVRGGGLLLEMSEDTAKKILVLGLP